MFSAHAAKALNKQKPDCKPEPTLRLTRYKARGASDKVGSLVDWSVRDVWSGEWRMEEMGGEWSGCEREGGRMVRMVGCGSGSGKWEWRSGGRGVAGEVGIQLQL